MSLYAVIYKWITQEEHRIDIYPVYIFVSCECSRFKRRAKYIGNMDQQAEQDDVDLLEDEYFEADEEELEEERELFRSAHIFFC